MASLKQLIKEMSRCVTMEDREMAHIIADRVLCHALLLARDEMLDRREINELVSLFEEV